ncbi:MAG: regulatory protein RecX [Chlamydiota bacterium]
MEVIDNKLFILISFDGRKYKKIDKKLYKKHLEIIRRCEQEKDLIAFIKEIEPKLALHYAYRLLAQRAYLTAELKAKLALRQISGETICQVILECQRLGYLNDGDWIRQFIKTKTSQGWGRARIERALHQKGAGKLKSAIVDEMFSLDQQRKTLAHWIEKKYPNYQQAECKLKGKIFRSLCRRGFDEALIREFLFRT